MTVFTALWLAWGLFFAIVEGVALFNKEPGDTLSENVRKWFGTKSYGGKATAWIRIRRIALLVFMVWLTIHFLTPGLF